MEKEKIMQELVRIGVEEILRFATTSEKETYSKVYEAEEDEVKEFFGREKDEIINQFFFAWIDRKKMEMEKE